MRYLITGAQGFAGRYVCSALANTDPRATIVGVGRSGQLDDVFTHTITSGQTRIPAPLPSLLKPFDVDRYRYVSCELNDAERLSAIFQQTEPDVVIHLAAALRDDASDALVDANVTGTTNLMLALRKLRRKPLVVFGSSGSVYGKPECLPLTERQRCSPYETYSITKFASELVARVLARDADISLVVARIFNIAGPGQDERHVCGRFAAQAAAVVRGEAPPTFTIGDLRPTRDFIDVRDVAQAIITLANCGLPGSTYNVATGSETAIRDVLAMTLRAAGLEGKVAIFEDYARNDDISRAYADITQLRTCGFRQRFTLDQTIDDLVSYYLHVLPATASTGVTTSANN